ncbi:MAG: FAD/NAD(P)-binding protein, partial [Kovacikia sp.]
MEMQSNQSCLDECYDIAIVGSGISCAYTLINYLSLLEQRSLPRIVKVAVLEKSGEFWAGIPYGSRSGRNTLVISSLKEFIPQELERSQFVSWLSQNRHWIFDIPEYKYGKLSNKWLEINEVYMAQGLWDELFIPRFTFGLYLQHRLTQLIESATTKGILQLSLLASEVKDIQPVNGLYKVDMAIASGHESLLAKKVILTIGSQSDRVINYFPEVENDICFVNNLYEPSQDFNIHRICEFLERPENQAPSQVLILGANASALEVLYCLSDSQRASGLISKFFVLSPSAAFPHRINHEVRQSPYFPRYLTSLIESKSFTARQILEAMKSEV